MAQTENNLISAVLAVAVAAMTLLSAPCAADIWGYVDDNGVAYLSDHQVNERYLLFKKEAPRPQVETFTPPVLERSMSSGTPMQVNAALQAQIAPLIARVAREYNLDASLLHAIITVESGYNPQAKSPAGAIGLMQLMPDTAARYAVKNIWDPLENLHGGARYLRDLLVLFKNNLDLTLAAYNAGERAVMQAGNKIPPYAETRAYVPSVLTQYDHYNRTSAASGTPDRGNRDKPLLIR
ncbi:MAG TPA: lytic transglycosylase domain-containing protein [Burkholderiales bacterium]|nr:lytic transglycosylase domain-containing protein [Burkholderiales bacterium]